MGWRCLIGFLAWRFLPIPELLAESLLLTFLALVVFIASNAYMLPILIGVEVLSALLAGLVFGRIHGLYLQILHAILQHDLFPAQHEIAQGYLLDIELFVYARIDNEVFRDAGKVVALVGLCYKPTRI